MYLSQIAKGNCFNVCDQQRVISEAEPAEGILRLLFSVFFSNCYMHLSRIVKCICLQWGNLDFSFCCYL